MDERRALTGGRAQSLTSGVARRPGTVLVDRRRVRRGGSLQWAVRALLPTALALWLLSLRHVELRGMRDFGLLQVLPVLFWVALGLLAFGFCLAMADRRTGHGWFAAYVLGLIAVVHASPTLLYPTLRYSWAWKHVAVVDAMIRHDGDVPGAGQLSLYNQWPGFFELNAFFLKSTGLDPALGYAAWAPPVFNALLLAPLLLLYRSVTRDRRLVWGGAWIFYSCSWVGQDYFAPQAFAFLLFVTVIALVMGQLPDSALRRPGTPRPGRLPLGTLAPVVLIEAVIVSSHPLTPLMLISALVALSLPRRNRRVVLPVLGCAVLLTAVWNVTVARSYMAAHLGDFVGSLTRTDANIVSGLATLGTAAPGQVVVSWVDRGLSAAVLLLAVLALLVRPEVRRTGLPLLALSPLPVLGANAYGGEMIFRAYLFALPAAAFLIASLLFERGGKPGLRAVAVYPVLVALLGGLVFGYYGKESANYFTKDEVAAVRFVTATAPPEARIVTLTSAVPGLYTRYEQYFWVQAEEWAISDRRRLVREPVAGLTPFLEGATAQRPAYVVLSRAQAADCYFRGVLPADTPRRLESALSTDSGFVPVYRNEDAVVFRYQGPERGERR